MRGRTKPALVGVFVLIAVVLGVASLIILGGGLLFEKTVPFVMFFDGSVMGLDIGAPVTFRGVKVGTVADMRVAVDEDDQPRIPVYVRLERDAIVPQLGMVTRAATEAYVQELVAEGLRAELRLESFVTGQLMVQLDFYPEEPPLLVGGDLNLPEIPTRRTGLEKLTQQVEQLPLDQIIERVMNALEGIDRLVNAPELRASLTDMAGALKEMRQLLSDMREQMGPARMELESSARSLRQLLDSLNSRVDPLAQQLESTAQETQKLVRNVNASVERIAPKLEKSADAATQTFQTAEKTIDLQTGPAAELVSKLTESAETADEALKQMTQTLDSIESGFGEQSPLQAEFSASLNELREAARSLRNLSEYLQRNPEALIRGRQQRRGGE